MRRAGLVLAVLLLAGCASGPAPKEPARRGSGGYYLDDGPGANPPPDLASIPDAVPREEPLNRFANRPYDVFGKRYVPLAAHQPYRERGIASWYGKKFHGHRTSSGEIYDMYAMTAAHCTLPIPSYARVTNLANGRSVVVRINDRGPFHSSRIIDLSYAAAFKLGYVQAGSARVEVQSVEPGAAAPRAAADAPGVYLQLGAFSSRQNAEAFRSQLSGRLAWLAQQMQLISVGELWRVHAGPYPSSDAARAAAQRIEAEIDLKPLVIAR
ncbi:MAG TPA: septal ring lytic transglycosylase RlpA family protein [Burkholderiales bacterium]|nr:septal ring lytic transglycosylase RlpA family protein [Burkholderiales bacterium]